MRSGGYKCYNYQCSGRVGNSTLCGEPGDNALSCADRLASPSTNADHIRGMSDEELAVKIMCPYDIDEEMCCKKCTCFDCCLDWLRQPWEGDNNA